MSEARVPHVEVDKTRCIGAGFCVADAPEIFEFDDEGLAEVRNIDELTVEDRLGEIAANCPAAAILLTD